MHLGGKGSLALLLPALLSVLIGCTANKMHRPVSVQREADYTLSFIEFDDQGEMWDPAQLSRALNVIERANSGEDGCVVVTYIHGWQHNASQKSEENEGGNVHDFKGFLELIADAVDSRNPNRPREVVGIYLGWRGKSGSIPGLNFATFYDRAGAARRIAGTSSTEVIYRILSTAKANPSSRVFFLGHSFGGQILERALTQALVGGLLQGGEGWEERPTADLVLLINPAAKSIHAKQFVEMLERSHIEIYRTNKRGERHKVPLLISLTSAADLATRWAFPAGTTIGTLGKNFHRYSEGSCLQFQRQRSFYIRTPGHNKALISHEVTAEPLAAGEPPAELGELRRDMVQTQFDPLTEQQVVSFSGSRSRFTLRSLSEAVNNTPYWIVSVPRQLIPGHSGFFTEDTLRLIGTIIIVSGALEPDSTTEIVRDARVRPVNLAVISDGRVLVSDASRRIFEVERESSLPISYGCLPPWADPSVGIGLEIRGERGVSAISRLSSKSSRKGRGEYQTLVMPFELHPDEIELGKPIQIDGTQQFVAAAFDIEGRRVFLSGPDRKAIYVADLGLKKPTPELWLQVGDEGVISDLYYDNSTGSLFAIGGQEGLLYRLTEHGEGPRPTLIADSLGWPVGLAVDEERNILYIGDAKGKQIWRIDCTGEGDCAEARGLSAGELLSSPADLDVTPDGTLWVADREAGVIAAVTPEGEVLQTITELPTE